MFLQSSFGSEATDLAIAALVFEHLSIVVLECLQQFKAANQITDAGLLGSSSAY